MIRRGLKLDIFVHLCPVIKLIPGQWCGVYGHRNHRVLPLITIHALVRMSVYLTQSDTYYNPSSFQNEDTPVRRVCITELQFILVYMPYANSILP